MRLQQLPARQGALWVGQGFLQFFRYPLVFSALFASFLFGCLLLLTVPWVGGLLSLAALPLVTLGFMIATRRMMESQMGSTPMVFVRPLQASPEKRRALIQLGLAYATVTLFVIALAGWVDGGSFAAIQAAMTNDKTTQEEMRALLQDPRLAWGMLIRVGLTGLLSVPFWHAPALTHWGHQPWVKAIFFSWMACWRNKGAFMVYSLTWVAVGGLFALVSSLVFGLLGQPKLVALATVPAVLMFSTVFYASLYFTYADCFAAGDPPKSEEKNATAGSGA